MTWIAAFVLLLEQGFVGGFPYVGVEGGSGYLNWTVSNIPTDRNLYIRNPADNASLMIFFSSVTIPYIIDRRANFTGDLLRGIVSFTLSNITLSDAGNYTLTASAGNTTFIFGGQVLVVAASPNVLGIIPLSLTAMAGKEYKLNCSTESRSAPLDHNLTMYTEWKKNGVNIIMKPGYIVNRTMLTISNLSRNDNGNNVTCRAFEDQRIISAESKASVLNVLYGPDIVQVTPSRVLTVREGLSMNITCTGECNPPCVTYQWKKDSSPVVLGSSQSYVIPEVRPNHSGIYICTVTNTNISKKATAEITVTVNYGAKIVNLTTTQDSNTANENSSASFHCHVDSNPLPIITWTRESNNTVLMTKSGALQSQFRIESAQCMDIGNYSCTAYNGIGTPVSEILQLLVKCHPRTDFLFPQKTKIYGKHHSAAILRYRVISYPLSTFTWTFIGNGNATKGLPVSASQHDDGHQSELRFTRLGIDDFGYYYVTANNSVYPTAKEVFEIMPADIPEVPSNVTVIDLTQNSVTIQWVAGYNGGPEQTFHIIASIGEFTRSVTVPDPGYRKKGIAVLDSLLPGTRYSIYMTAINAVGSSNKTEAIIIVTREEASTHEHLEIPVGGIAAGIVAGFVVILCVVIGIFLWRRYQRAKQHEHITDNDIKRECDERSQIKASSVKQDAASGKVYEGLHFRETETSQYLELNDIALEENRNGIIRPPENESYEKLHPYTNNDIQMYSSLKIPETSKGNFIRNVFSFS